MMTLIYSAGLGVKLYQTGCIYITYISKDHRTTEHESLDQLEWDLLPRNISLVCHQSVLQLFTQIRLISLLARIKPMFSTTYEPESKILMFSRGQ